MVTFCGIVRTVKQTQKGNKMNAAYISYLIVKAYREAVAHENEICTVTEVNDPVRVAAILASCEAFVVVKEYDLLKEAGITFFNVFD